MFQIFIDLLKLEFWNMIWNTVIRQYQKVHLLEHLLRPVKLTRCLVPTRIHHSVKRFGKSRANLGIYHFGGWAKNPTSLLGVGRGFSIPTSPLIRASKFSKTHGNLAIIATATSKKNEGILSDDSLLYITKTPVDAGRCLPSNTSRL